MAKSNCLFCFRLLGFAWFCLLYTCIFGQYKKYKCILLYADDKGSHLKCYPLELSRPDTALFQEVKTVSAALPLCPHTPKTKGTVREFPFSAESLFSDFSFASCLRSGSQGLTLSDSSEPWEYAGGQGLNLPESLLESSKKPCICLVCPL